jgi:amidohydrolase
VLEGVDEIYGLHVWPLLEAGQFAISLGPFLGQADFFNLEITGKGGHAAFPHLANDPIVIGCQFVTMVQTIVSRNVDPLESAVVSITKFQGGTTDNVIPPSVQIEGTIRTLKNDVQKGVRQRFENMVSSIASAHGARFDLHYQEGYPVTYNHEPCVSRALSIAKELVDETDIIYPFPPIMGSEDFGYYSEKIPACFIGLGVGNKEKGIVNMCHHPYFDVDESCLLYGMAMHTSLALSVEGKSVG